MLKDRLLKSLEENMRASLYVNGSCVIKIMIVRTFKYRIVWKKWPMQLTNKISTTGTMKAQTYCWLNQHLNQSIKVLIGIQNTNNKCNCRFSNDDIIVCGLYKKNMSDRSRCTYLKVFFELWNTETLLTFWNPYEHIEIQIPDIHKLGLCVSLPC